LARGALEQPGEVFSFSNENIFVKILDNVREKDVFVVQPTCRPVNQSIMELLIMIDAFKRASAGRITAVIPYYSYGRSDKKDQPRVPITARLVADMITVAGADRVLTMDLHQGQIQGFFNIPVDELTAVHLLSNYFRQKQIQDLVGQIQGEVKSIATGINEAAETIQAEVEKSDVILRQLDQIRVDAAEIREIEPHATGLAALHSPRTAITGASGSGTSPAPRRTPAPANSSDPAGPQWSRPTS